MSCFDNNKCNDNKKIYNDALKKIENAKKNKPIGCNCISKNNPSSLTGPTGPTGPQGLIGPTGPTGATGPSNISRSAFLVTFNDGTSAEGISVGAEERIPIDRKELDISNLITLNSDEETIKFNTAGYYKITFIVSAYVLKTDTDFDPKNDFVTLGFRLIDTDNIYIGASKWVPDEIAKQVTSQGILAVNNPANEYEIVNLGKKTIYLDTPDLNDISSKSYFTNSLVTIVIEYLGRQ